MEPLSSESGALAASRQRDELASVSDTLSSIRLSTPPHISTDKQVVEPMVSVADFPVELIIMIFKFLGSRGAEWTNGYRKKETRADDGRFHRFDIWRDMVNFAATCRRIHECITPMIYRLDNYAFHSSALLLSAKRGNVTGISKALEFGAQIDSPDCTELWILDEKKTTRTPIALRLASLHWASYHRHLNAIGYFTATRRQP